MRNLKSLGAFIAGLFFSGCVDLNITSAIPKVDYYHFGKMDFKTCANPTKVRLELEIPPFINTTNILSMNNFGKINYLENAKWIDLPSILLTQSLKARALEKCIFLTSIGAESRGIFIRVREFYIKGDSAVVSLFYTNHQLSQSKIIKEEVPIKSNSKDSQIQAMQLAIDKVIAKIVSQL